MIVDPFWVQVNESEPTLRQGDYLPGCLVTLPYKYVLKHASNLNDRWRLKSPYLEHFSQAFAHLFMRVDLPSAIEPF